MMPIIDLQRRLTVTGRLRMGTSRRGPRGGKLPVRLETWRVTSQDEERLHAMAELYGGEVKPWTEREGEFELVTERDQLPVLIVPGQGFSQWWELWSRPVAGKEGQAGVPSTCVRRCDGRTEQISGEPCMCPTDYDDRKELAQDYQACSPYTRLSVMLPEVPGLGLWTLVTSGFYAAVELQGVVGLLEEATRRGMFFPAVLRIEWRRGVTKGGQRTTYPVPVVDIAVRAPDVFQIAGTETSQLMTQAVAGELPSPTYTPIDPESISGVTVEQGLGAVTVESTPTRTARSAAPVGRETPPPPAPVVPSISPGEEGESRPSLSPEGITGPEVSSPEPPVVPTPEPQPVVDAERVNVISDAQRRRLWAIVGEYGVPEDYVRQVVVEVTGQDSTAAITKDLYDAVVTCVQAWQSPGGETGG